MKAIQIKWHEFNLSFYKFLYYLLDSKHCYECAGYHFYELKRLKRG